MSKMIELHDIDVPGFLSVLDSCEGNVYLMTRDGCVSSSVLRL